MSYKAHPFSIRDRERGDRPNGVSCREINTRALFESSHVDVADGPVDGGVMDRATIGINWWATRRWKLGVDYGAINLNGFGLDGVTYAFHTRIQWAY